MVTSDQLSKLLKSESLHLVSTMDDASNETFLATIGDIEVIYKPVSGEAPLWDFPLHTLSKREVMAHWVSDCLGWNLIPTTVWTERGPLGPGSIQVFIENAQVQDVSIFELDQIPESWVAILEGELDGKDVVVAHANKDELMKLAAFDVIINNGDRKAGHILRDPLGRIQAIDHGVAFHVTEKLRTVLWGWVGESVPDVVAREIQAGLDVLEQRKLEWVLTDSEFEQMMSRGRRLLRDGFPQPSKHWPAVPWPIF